MMKKIGKKILCLMLVGMMSLLSGGFVQAATLEKTEPSIETITGFIARSDDGTIWLDIDSAERAGFSDEAVAYVEDHIEYMNELVKAGQAYIDDEFRAIIENSQTRATTAGVSKLVIYPYGLVQLYMTSAEASEMYGILTSLGEVCPLLNIAAQVLSGTFEANLLQLASAVGNLTIWMYRAQLDKALSYGTGVVMTVVDADYSGTNKMVTFSAQ